MQNSNIAQPKDESTKSLHDYLSNNSYKHLLALSLISMFAIVFYLIYLIIDSLIDKSKHYRLSLEQFERYEKSSRRRQLSLKEKKAVKSPNTPPKHLNSIENNVENEAAILPLNSEDEIAKKKEMNEIRNKKIEFTVWTNRNLQISFLHSLMCSIWLIRIIWFRNTEMFSDLLTFVSWDTYLLLAFSCGYFLYDFYDIYANGFFKKEWVVCLHHWIVLISFSYHMMNLLSIGYTVVALLMEFNSVFLHSRKLLRFYKFDRGSAVFRLNSIFNILTFIFFRFGVLAIIYYGIFYDGHRVTVSYLVMLCSCVFAMTIINIVLFKRILVKDFFTCSRKKNQINQDQNKADEQIECSNIVDLDEHKSNSDLIKQINNHNDHHIAITNHLNGIIKQEDPNNNMVLLNLH